MKLKIRNISTDRGKALSLSTEQTRMSVLLSTCLLLIVVFLIPLDSQAAFDPQIRSLLDQVSIENLRRDVQRLQDFGTRYAFSDSIDAVSDWLFNRFVDLGYEEVSFDQFSAFGETHRNVVAIKRGTKDPDKIVVIGGHYNSIVTVSGGNPLLSAPGADDNATGTSATLEIARILQPVELEATVYFVLFAVEELGLLGSRHFVEVAEEQGLDIQLMINLDALGHNPDSTKEILIVSDEPSLPFAEIAVQIAKDYTNLVPISLDSKKEIELVRCDCSDHQPFIDAGYRAIALSEANPLANPNIHLNTDLIGTVQFSLFGELTQVALGVLTSTAGIEVITAVLQDQDEENFPEAFALHQNYPNPFNENTLIAYTLPQTADVTMTIYNQVGQTVAVLVKEVQDPGYHTIAWDARDQSGFPLSSGIYFYRLATGDFQHTDAKRMLLLK